MVRRTPRNRARPRRDPRCHLAGTATILDVPQRPDIPVELAGRTFPWTCPIRIGLPHGLRDGPPVTDLIDRLELVRKPAVWGAYLRQSPIRMSDADWHTMIDTANRWKPDT